MSWLDKRVFPDKQASLVSFYPFLPLCKFSVYTVPRKNAPESLGDLFFVRSESLHVAFLCKCLGVSLSVCILQDFRGKFHLCIPTSPFFFLKLYMAPKAYIVNELFVSRYSIHGVIEPKCRRKNWHLSKKLCFYFLQIQMLDLVRRVDAMYVGGQRLFPSPPVAFRAS